MNTKNCPSHEQLAPMKNLAAILAMTILLFPAGAPGIGLRIPNQDAEAMARGNAFAATADNPSAIYYNPAGITQIQGQEFQVGDLNYFGINVHYDSPAGSTSDTKFNILPVPQAYYVYSPTNFPLSFGLGVYAPFGLGVDWPPNSGFRSIALSSSLQYITANPVVAWQALPSLSVAVGPTFNYSELKFNRGVTSPTDFFQYAATGFSVGFNAGILWQPLTQLSFGANYRSASTMNYGGLAEYNSGANKTAAQTEASIPFPQIVSGGISYRPTPDWNIEADVDWSDWSTLGNVTLDGTKKIFGVNFPLQLNWHNSWMYEIGATRHLGNGWNVSAGYFYCGDTAPSKYFTPAIPDTVLHVGCLGVSHEGEHWMWAIAAQIIAGPVRDVTDSQPNPFTGQSGNGKYQLISPTLSISLGYRF